MILAKVLKLGAEQSFFISKKINEIEKSCCASQECEIIDFDETAKKISMQQALQTVSSCDGLKICSQYNRIDFIELKGFEFFKKHRLKSSMNNEEQKNIISTQVNKFDFNKKLKDSLFLLDVIVRLNSFSVTTSEQKKFFDSKKRYFIVTDLTSDKDGIGSFMLTMSFLSHTASIDRYIETCLEQALDNLPCSELKIEKPILTSCNKICNLICEN